MATLHRVKPETSSLIHDTMTESYYILSGSGTPHGFSELDGPISYLVFRFLAK